MTVIGLGSIAVFAVCARILGGSTAESNAAAPLGHWSSFRYEDAASDEIRHTFPRSETSGGETKTR